MSYGREPPAAHQLPDFWFPRDRHEFVPPPLPAPSGKPRANIDMHNAGACTFTCTQRIALRNP